MPWRSRPDPYRVWISEVMLQQTQVETVIPYFERFLHRFPTVHVLAAAEQEDVLKAWEGLGYYARARNLYRAARAIVAEHGGRLPRSYDVLRKLPGLGPYTAAAVASISFGEPVPVVDGNVLRVFARFFGIEEDTRRARTRTLIFRRLAPYVESLARNPSYGPELDVSAPVEQSLLGDERTAPLAADRPRNPAGDFNQAIMEVGALICRRVPRCLACPLREACVAHRDGRTAELPVRSQKKRTPHYEVAVGVIWHDGRLLIGRRRTDQMLGGLWEFPGGKRETDEPLEETARREIHEETGLEVRVGPPYTVVQHAYSHFRITLTAYRCTPIGDRVRLLASPRSADELRWVTPEELDAYPFPRASLKVIERIREAEARQS